MSSNSTKIEPWDKSLGAGFDGAGVKPYLACKIFQRFGRPTNSRLNPHGGLGTDLQNTFLIGNILMSQEEKTEELQDERDEAMTNLHCEKEHEAELALFLVEK